MSVRKTVLSLVVAALAVAGGWQLFRSSHPASGEAQAQAAAPAGEARGQRRGGAQSGGAGRVVAVSTALAKSEDVPLTRRAIGWIEPVASVVVRPRVDGVVTAVKVADGQTVKAGDVLLTLDDRAIAATIAKDQAQIAKDQASLDQAEADLARTQALAGKQVVTAQQLQQQQAAVKGFEASVAIDKAALQADEVQRGYTTISAPIDGRVGAVNTSVGNLVRAADQGTGLFTITAMAPLRASFAVPEQDLPLFRQSLASGAEVPVEARGQGEGAADAKGRLSFIDSAVDTNAGSVTVKALFDNKDGALWPGQYVALTVTLQNRRGLTVVPSKAVQVNEQGSFVYVVKPDGRVSRQPVKAGETIGEETIIASGISPGDHVVVEGQLNLTPGATARETLVADNG